MGAPASFWMSPEFRGPSSNSRAGEQEFDMLRRALSTSSSSRQLGQPSFQEPALRLLSRELDRALVGRARRRGPTQPAAQVGARRVRQVVVSKVAAGKDGVDKGQTRG